MAKIALQLFTVRDEIKRDLPATLRGVAEIGYRHVELYDMFGYAPADLRKVCQDCGLSIPSWMAYFERLRDSLPEVIETTNLLGCKYVVCPAIPEEYRTVDGYAQAGEILDKTGRELAKYDLILCYHNHKFEFEPLDGEQIGFDILYKMSSSNLLKAEFDIYWAAWMQHDPLSIIKELGSRIALLHIEDMASDESRIYTEVGQGCMDISEIVRQAILFDVEYLIVEQYANWKDSQLASAKVSFENLTKVLYQV